MRTILFIILISALLIIWQCATLKPTASGVEAALKHYDNLIKKVDGDYIAMMYTTDGDLGNSAHGRAAIKKMLDGFKNFKVLEQKSTSNSINIKGDSALQKGFYNQTAVVGKDTYRIKKSFTIHWAWINKKEWLVKRFDVD